MKTCPFCAEDIQDAAIVCKHCSRDLTGRMAGTIPQAQRSGMRPVIRLTLIVLLVGAIGLVTLGVVARFLNAVKSIRDATGVAAPTGSRV